MTKAFRYVSRLVDAEFFGLVERLRLGQGDGGVQFGQRFYPPRKIRPGPPGLRREVDSPEDSEIPQSRAVDSSRDCTAHLSARRNHGVDGRQQMQKTRLICPLSL